MILPKLARESLSERDGSETSVVSGFESQPSRSERLSNYDKARELLAENARLRLALLDADDHLRLAGDIAGPREIRSNLAHCRRRIRAALAGSPEQAT